MKAFSTILLSISVFLYGCSGDKDKNYLNSVTTSSQSSESAVYYLDDQNNNLLARISNIPGSPNWEISYNNEIWTTKLKEDKRKFYTDAGEIFAEIKFKDDGFKLRDPQGRMLWKVKLYDEKIKISDNEEMNDPFEVKKRGDALAKIYRHDKEIGRIEWNAEVGATIVSNGERSYRLRGPNYSYSTALFLIEDIQPEHKLMILTQLISSER